MLLYTFTSLSVTTVLNSITQVLEQGFAIGNGLTDPAIQYGAYGDYALDMGLITKSEYKTINKVLPVCEAAIKLCGKHYIRLVSPSSTPHPLVSPSLLIYFCGPGSGWLAFFPFSECCFIDFHC